MRPIPLIRTSCVPKFNLNSRTLRHISWRRRRFSILTLSSIGTLSILFPKAVLSQSEDFKLVKNSKQLTSLCITEQNSTSDMNTKNSNDEVVRNGDSKVSSVSERKNSGFDASSVGPAGQAVCGALAGAVARCIVAPLDVVKIRLQVQLEPVGGAGAKYKSMAGTVATILKEEGVVGLWRGTLPAVMFWMPYTAVQFTTLGQVNKMLAATPTIQDWDPSARAFLSGAAAGATATLTSYPLDLIRTNIAAQGEPKVYHSMAGCASSIVRQRGIRGLYAGLTPTLLEIIPHSGFQFGAYDLFKRIALWGREMEQANESHLSPSGALTGRIVSLSSGDKFACGFAAGSVAKAVVHPLDVVKKRLQIAGLARNPAYGKVVGVHTYTGLIDAFKKIIKTEGTRGLFKGLTPNLLKAAPSSAITLAVYEFIIGLISEGHG